MKRFGAIVTCLLTASSSVFAGGVGTTSSPFLKIPVSGRATALGGTFAAVSGDVTAIDFNPAGLCGLERTDMRATYIDYLEDTSLQSFSIGFPFSVGTERAGAYENGGFSKNKVMLGLEYRAFRAEDTARNSVGIKLEDFDVRDQLINVSMAYPILSRLALGASGKFISNKVQDDSVSRFGFDVGTLAKITNEFNAGVSVQNIGGSKALEDVADPLPTTIRGGATYQLNRWLFLADLASSRDSVLRKSGGIEVEVNRLLKLRGGVSHDTSIQFSGGLGIQFNGPEKATQYQRRPPPEKKQPETVHVSPMANQIIDQMGSRLTLKFKSAVSATKPRLAVLPFASKDQSGAAVSKLITDKLNAKNEFSVVERSVVEQVLKEQKVPDNGAIDSLRAAKLGKMVGADYVVVGNIDEVEEKYVIGTRIVDTEDGEILVTDYAEVATEDFAQKSKNTLETAKTPTRTPDKGFANTPSTIDIGLDYGLTTHEDLGITHTVTLRVLY